MTGALPFSECNERLPFLVIQRPTGANAILLRQKANGQWLMAKSPKKKGLPRRESLAYKKA